MALLLIPDKIYTVNTGSICNTAYLRIGPIETNNKDNQIQEFFVSIYNSKYDKKKVPLLVTQVTVLSEDYISFFSPVALANKSIYASCYDYILMVAKKYNEELDEFSLMSFEEKTNYRFKYSDFAWLQGDIWVSDEV